MAIQDIFVAHRVRLSNHSGMNALVTDQSSFTILHKIKHHQGGGAGRRLDAAERMATAIKHRGRRRRNGSQVKVAMRIQRADVTPC